MGSVQTSIQRISLKRFSREDVRGEMVRERIAGAISNKEAAEISSRIQVGRVATAWSMGCTRVSHGQTWPSMDGYSLSFNLIAEILFSVNSQKR